MFVTNPELGAVGHQSWLSKWVSDPFQAYIVSGTVESRKLGTLVKLIEEVETVVEHCSLSRS
jgi:hypothetical protein